MSQFEREVVKGILRVESFHERVLDPNGRNPVCKPKLGRWVGVSVCERCGDPIDVSKEKPCSAVPPEQRWSMKAVDNIPFVGAWVK